MDNRVLLFLFNKMPLGVIVFGRNMEIICMNRKAEYFFRHYHPPQEMETIVKRMFHAIATSRLNQLFPGEIYLEKSIDGSPSRWSFAFLISEKPEPIVSVFISEKALSDKLDINSIRRQYRLTRREADVVRRMLDGLKNTDIADVLEISEQTVKDHLSNIYRKVDVDNRFDFARVLLDLPEPQGVTR